MGVLIEWLKGNAAPNDYVEVSEVTPLPVSQPLVTDSAPLSVKVPSELIHAGSKQGRVNLSTTAVALKIGATSLAGRHTLTIYNDASTNIFVGFNSNVTGDDGYRIASGSGVTFKFDPAELVEVYGVLEGEPLDVAIVELK